MAERECTCEHFIEDEETLGGECPTCGGKIHSKPPTPESEISPFNVDNDAQTVPQCESEVSDVVERLEWEKACEEIDMGGIFAEFQDAPDAIRQLGLYIREAEQALPNGSRFDTSLAGEITTLLSTIHDLQAERDVAREEVNRLATENIKLTTRVGELEAENKRLLDAIRAMFRQKYGDHPADKWEWAAQGREKSLALLLPEHKHHNRIRQALTGEQKDED